MRVAEIFRSYQGEGRLTGTESIFVRVCGCNLRCRYCDTPYASWRPEGEDLSVEEILTRIAKLDAVPSPPLPPGEGRGEREVGRGWSACHPLSAADCTDKRESALPFVIRPHPGPLRAPTVGRSGEGTVFPHIVLTGGEPMLFAELIPLSQALRAQNRHITIETAGTFHLPVACDLMSISPKMSNSVPDAANDPRWAERHGRSRSAPEVIAQLAAEYDCQFKFVVDCLADCREVEEYLSRCPQIERGRVMLMPQGTDPGELAAKAQWLEPYCRTHGLLFCPRRHIEWFGSRRGV